MQTHIITAPWNEYKSALMKIRTEVFVVEQGVPSELERDVHDDYSEHFLAINEIGQHLGCARLMQSGQIGRMAVTKELRGCGVGANLLAAAVERAKELRLSRVFLHAQSYTENFYRKGGFLPFGTPFEEAGIPHIAMEMKLPLTFPKSAAGLAKQTIVRQQNSEAAHSSVSSATPPP
ncbi:MAG: GNAT family N-acetyltransferase, partial [Gammaproteobacteria bacterium]|nr:GNAT family N-acetyltransferase [Gammaproteobacteria bacterium]